MESALKKAVSEAAGNIYGGVRLSAGTLVFLWALLCLFVLNRIKSPLWATVSGAAYYLSLGAACFFFFRGMETYLVFPKENRKIPGFIGHRLDTVFVYPLLLMAVTGIISNILASAGLYPVSVHQAEGAGEGSVLLLLRLVLLPPAAFAEEMFNLLLVSFFYTNIKLSGTPRLLCSMLAAALAFGLLHASAWGLGGAVSIGISYLPVFFMTLYTGNIWISFLAHLYNNITAFAKAYYSGSHILVLSAVAVIPAIWSIKALLRKH